MPGTESTLAVRLGPLAFLLLTGRAELWHLVALGVARGVASSFFFPASQGLVPQAVSPGRRYVVPNWLRPAK